MKIGVFDSGKGGLSVANFIEKSLPGNEIIFKNDSANVPYGSRNPAEVLKLITPIFNSLVSDGCQVIVVACNSVSTTLIDDLRSLFSIPLIAVEPMLELAVELTNSGVIAVCATPATLASDRYRYLKSKYAGAVDVIEPDCNNWSAMIEDNKMNQVELAAQIKQLIGLKADVIVLGCTHYHWIEEDVLELAKGKAKILQPEQEIVVELKLVLQQLQQT